MLQASVPNNLATDLTRFCTASTWAAYLNNTNQATIIVPNILQTSDLSHELQGLRAMQAAGVDVNYIELGNEMYDHTVPAIVAAYHASADNYSQAMGPWVNALRNSFPHAKLAIVGRDTAWNKVVLASRAGQHVDAITFHAYTHLPEGPYATSESYKAVTDQAFLKTVDMQQTFIASVPARYELWVTEYGAYGGRAAQDTWIKALFMAKQSMHMGNSPWTTILLPYCLVCADPFAPAFNTSRGSVVPGPNNSTSAARWSRSPTGVAMTALFNFTANVALFRPVTLALPASLQHNASWCSLQNAGIVGAPINKAIKTTSQQACMDYCIRTPRCAYWQMVTDTNECYLKNASATYSSNGGSVAGPVECTTASGIDGWLSDTKGLLINASPHPISCYDLSEAWPDTAVEVRVYGVKTMQDLGRHRVREKDLLLSTATEASSCISLPAWSLATISTVPQ
eukprot:TRINITY_DN11266_c0_g1_i4.p1 TRINITY_DN11266_c0_g1~~TRINITY_DN11266_c0_g1_i4.p1  ORF type:complete len:455 (+),score=64.29 TRINITY_DN11266_c0_g1_i4:285-1649(+)